MAWALACLVGFFSPVLNAQPSGAAGEPRARGLRPPTVAETARLRELAPAAESVRLNARALSRSNEERKVRGLAPLALPVVPDGEEVIVAPRVSAGGTNASSELLRSAAASAPAAVSATSTVALGAATLPSAADNSTLAAFPPVRNQGQIGSCACFSSVYYMSTFAIAQARGLNVRNSGDADKLSPKFVYNLVNQGGDNGSWFTDIFEVLLKHGAPTWSDFPYSGVDTPSSYLDWPVASATWRGAISNRMASSYQLTALDTEAGLTRLKTALANGALVVFASNVFGWQFGAIANDPATADDNAFVGRPVVTAIQINESGHAMTVVGYNDNLWIDLNKNGVVDAGEKGALRIVNSWGTSWQDAGFVWVAYDALRSVSAVSGVGPDITTNRAGSGTSGSGSQKPFWDATGYALVARPSYTPRLLAEFSLKGVTARNQIFVSLGRGTSSETQASTTYDPGALRMQGGVFAFNGTATAIDGTFAFDLTDLIQTGSNRYFVTVYAGEGGSAVTLANLRLLDAQGSTLATGATGLPAQVNPFASAYLGFSVTSSAPAITSALSATGAVNAAFTYLIVASNSPTAFGAPNLPAGLVLNAQSGAITGTPLSAGTTSVTISATNASGTDSRTLAITVAAAVIPPVITSAGTATGTSGSAFTYQIVASNSPVSYGTSGSLPNGLSVNTTTGLISGTPAQTGSFSMQVLARNAGGTGSRTVNLTIAAPVIPVPVISSATAASVDAGNLLNYRIQAAGAVSFGAQNLPSGLTVDATTGVITGRVTLARSYQITLTATNPTGTGYATLNLEVRGGSSFGPVNDNFANRIILNGTAANTTGSTSNASAEPGEPGHAGSPAGTSVWWSWIAPSTGTLTLATTGSVPAPRVGVYTGTSVATLNPVNPTTTGGASFAVTSGTTYQIALDSIANATGSVALSLALSAPPIAPPANDHFSAATPLSGATATATALTTAASAETGEPAHGSVAAKSVWYKWTAPAAGTCTVTTRGSDFDTVLAIYTGTAVNALTLVARDDDSGGNSTSATAFVATSGTTYFLAVDGYGGASGNVALSLAFTTGVTRPANDNFAAPTVLVGESAGGSGATNLASSETGEPAHAGSVATHSVWFRWTATGTGPVTVSTAGSAFDTVLAVYTGSAVGALQLVASDDDGGGSSSSLLTFSATSGVVYSLAIDGFRGAAGNYSLSLGLSPGAPANNDFSAAATLTAGVRATATNTLATAEVGEPAHYAGGTAPNAAAKSLWWRWTPTATGFVSLTTAGSNFDTVLAVYTGSALSALSRVAENDEATTNDSSSGVFFRAVAGRTYSIAVDGYLGASGFIVLNLTPAGNPSAVYATNFEAFPTGTGQLVGQEQWTELYAPASGGAQGILAQGIPGQGRGGYLGFDAPAFGTNTTATSVYVYRPLNFDPVAETVPIVQVRADVLIVGSTNGRNDVFRLSLFNKAGYPLGGVSFDTANLQVSTSNGDAIATTSATFAFNTRYTILGTFNFTTKRWTARMNGVDLTVDSAFAVGVTTGVDVGDFDFVWTLSNAQRLPGDNFIVFDNFAITADAEPIAVPVLQLPTAPTGVLGAPFAYAIGATNAPIREYGATNLPPGLSLNTITGLVAGTPTQTGSFTVSFTATNLRGQSAASSTVFTILAGPPAITSVATATAEKSKAFSHQIIATNSPQKFTIIGSTALPSGLTLDNATGLISGSPLVTGRYSVTLSAENAAGAGTASFVLNVAASVPVPANQTITFGALATKTFGDAPLPLSATASSGLSVTYASANTAVATVSGNTVTIVGVGTTTITASQIGDANYNTAPAVVQTLTVNKAAAAVSLGNLAATYDSTPKAATVATTPSGLTTNVTYDGSATAPTNAGSYAVVGTIANANYAGTASGTLVIAKANQTITFGALAAKANGDAPFTLGATASSGLAVSYASSNTAVATVSGSTVTIVGAGTTTITASQAGNANYSPATAATQTLTLSGTTPQYAITTFTPQPVDAGGEVTLTGTFPTGSAPVITLETAGSTTPVATLTAGSNSASQLKATVPAGTASGTYALKATFGTGNTAVVLMVPTFVVGTGGGTPPQYAITTFNPQPVAAGGQVTLTGTFPTGSVPVITLENVGSTTAVATLTPGSNSASQVVATVPAGTASGTYGLKVKFGTAGASGYAELGIQTFVVGTGGGTTPQYAITTFTPQPVAAGGEVTLTGTFPTGSVPVITLETAGSTTPVATLTAGSNSASQLKATVPAGTASGTYALKVTFGTGNTAVVLGIPTFVVGTGGGTTPVITTQPVSQAVALGASVTLTVVATGTPAPTFQWRKNGTAISGATNASYTIASVGSADLASYNVVVANSVDGVPSSAAILTLSATGTAPVITTQPVSQAVALGASVTFTVVATGTPAPTYQWRKNGTAINGATNASYTLANVVSADLASYTVAATNSVDTVVSNAAILSVSATGTAPVITTQPLGRLAAVETGVIFSVVATGSAGLTYQWKKDGGVLAESTRITGATSATLSVANLAAADAGSYTVVVANGSLSTTSSVAALTVVDVRATHAVAGPGYVPGGTVTVNSTVTYAGPCVGLAWTLLLPEGWTYASGGGAEGETKPPVGSPSLLEWAWTNIPASPVTFSTTLNVPSGAVGAKTLAASAIFRIAAGPLTMMVKPDPLTVSAALYHSADTGRDLRIGLVELTRVIELYNTRIGTARTGCYKIESGSEDGFTPESTRTASTVVTLASWHSADSNRDGKIGLLELTRVIELYNYRSGSIRTGAYHLEVGTEDGFALGP